MPPKFLFIDQVHIGSEYLMDRIEDVHGVSVADFNSDKYPDIYLTCRKGINHLLINQSNGIFQDFVIESGTGGSIESRIGKQKYEYGSIAVDFDRDGDNDLLLNGKRKTTRYFLNEGNAIFKNFTAFIEEFPGLEAIDGAVTDLGGDGYPDLIFADDNKGLRILRNMKYNRFIEEDLSYLDLPETGIRAVKSADLNGDMRSDIIAAYYHKPPYILWNKGDRRFECETLFNPHAESFPEYINSISLADINYDGYNDIYLCSENAQDVLLFYDAKSGYFMDVSMEYGIIREGRSYSAVPGDYDLNGTLDLYVSRYGNDILYLNTGREFVNRWEDLLYSKAGYLSGLNTGAACLDINSDGRSDVIVGNSEYWSSLLENQLHWRDFLKLTLEGLTDSRECLGAKIYIWPAEKEHVSENLLAFREVILSYGYFSQVDADIIFGISDTVDIRIRYQSGDIKDIDSVVPGSHLTVIQGSSPSRLFMAATRKLSLWLHIPIVRIGMTKFLIFLILIFFEMRFIEIRYPWSSFYIIIYFVSNLILYILIGVYLENTGLIHHFIPFLILFLAMVILVGVNEPMRKTSILSQNRQEQIYKAGMKLATTFTIEEAVDIIKNTLDAVFPYEQFSIFSYQQTSHLFLKLTDSGTAALRVEKFKLEREAVEMLVGHYEPLRHRKHGEFWPTETPSDRDELLFPLIRKNTLIGLIFIHFTESEDENPLMETAPIIYLFQQLAIALDNIQIMNSLREQEKIAAIGTFSSGIIHDLKNPVDGLRMIIESLANETDTEDPKREYIEELGEGIIQLKKRLLKSLDLINYRQDTLSRVNAGGLIRELLADKALLEFSEFDISIEDKEIYMYANREQMGYALENIIYNAVEAGTLNDRVSIGLTKNDRELMVRVTDSGKGISDSELDRIFNIFYTTKGDNRGLGLAITSNIIKNHGGRIDVSSEMGVGRIFMVTMPLYGEEGE